MPKAPVTKLAVPEKEGGGGGVEGPGKSTIIMSI